MGRIMCVSMLRATPLRLPSAMGCRKMAPLGLSSAMGCRRATPLRLPSTSGCRRTLSSDGAEWAASLARRAGDGTRTASGTSKVAAEAEAVTPPPRAELKKFFVASAVPMIGFGFMDNLIMIQAGDLIDNTTGVRFGLATLTAAAFGQVRKFGSRARGAN